MSDKPIGMILAAAIAVPAMIACCVGGAAFVGSAAAGLVGYLSGSGLQVSALLALVAGVTVLAVRAWQRARRASCQPGAGRG